MKKSLIATLLLVSGIAHAGIEQPLQQAINQVGSSCDKVTQVFQSSGTYNMYSVACSGGQTYMVLVKPETNSAKVMTCREMAMIGTKCFVKL